VIDVSAVLDELDALLAQSDTAAFALFKLRAASLQQALGAPCAALAHQLERFDFAAARETLQGMRRDLPPT
jgi:hypothetical protein